MALVSAPAFAQDAASTVGAAVSPGGGLLGMLPLLLIFVIFYFLIIRPQTKKMKEHQEMVKNVRKGDRVVTGGGLIGTVQRVDEGELVVRIAPEVDVTVLRSTITSVEAKGMPLKTGQDNAPGGKTPLKISKRPDTSAGGE